MSVLEHVHLIFKTHLDIGFTNLAAEVVDRYFTHYIPEALKTAKELREEGTSDRFIWTTGAWLIYEYLEKSSLRKRVAMEEAIAAGDIIWHGLPFTTHSELLDPSLFRYGLSLSQRLDHRFGKRTVAAKMTDVPGHTRGIVPLLAEAGIRFLHIGVNPASTAPTVPPVFIWQDHSGAEIIVMYQAGSYGDFAAIPGLRAALAFAHTNDNLGPQSRTEVQETYQQLRACFPHLRIIPSTLDAFAEEIWSIRAKLPLVTGEIGDTWIHGAGTDPQKLSQFRQLTRLRRQWLEEGKLKAVEDRTDRFSNGLLLVAEHTWGMDEKEHLDNYTDYTPEQLRALRQQERPRIFEASWQEQRNYLQQSMQALYDTPEFAEAQQSLAMLVPRQPDRSAFQPLTEGALPMETTHFTLGIDPLRGALTHVLHKATGRTLASRDHPLALFLYETFGQADYDRFWLQYVSQDPEVEWWARRDFTKPGIESIAPGHQSWHPGVSFIGQRRDQDGEHFLIELCMPQESITHYGAPQKLTLEISAPHIEPILQFTFQWFEKQANRLPEALWLSFNPETRDEDGWLFEKLGIWISPREVVVNGNRKLHAVGQGVYYRGEDGQLLLETLDAPLIAPGKPSLLDFNQQQPSMRHGIHVNLYNNVWGTNFPMWNEEDARFRFALHIDHASSAISFPQS